VSQHPCRYVQQDQGGEQASDRGDGMHTAGTTARGHWPASLASSTSRQPHSSVS
jgi:hypothetical protein